MKDQQTSGNELNRTDKLQIYLEEYKVIYSHIIERAKLRHTLFNYTIVLLVAVIAAGTQIYDKESLLIVFLFFPFPFYALAALLLENDFVIATIIGYFHNDVRPKIAEILHTNVKTILNLEDYMHELRKSLIYRCLAGSRYLLILLPAFASIIVYWQLNWCFSFFSVILTVIHIIVVMLLLRALKKIPNPPDFPKVIEKPITKES